ncbi:ribonuclease H-like domain-containing protein [Tanacetum coccineum]
MVKPVWNNAQRVNHQNFAKKTHPCAKKNLVQRAVLMKSGLVSVNTARQVNSAHSKTTVNAARPMPYFSKTTYSTVKKPIHKNTTFKNNNINQRVNTVRGKNVNTARPKAVVNAVKENNFNAVKASACWVWKAKTKVLDHGNPQMDLQDQGVIDSGCSRHMTGNMSYLTDYEEIDGGYVAFGGNPKGGKITRKCTIKTGNLDFENVYFVRELKFNLFSVSQMCDKKNSVLFNDTECIVLSPNFKLIDESQVLLRVPRKNNMYSVDLKNIVPKGEVYLPNFLKMIKPVLLVKRESSTEPLFCEMKGILRQFSVARTPQQNGVAERKNMTLIEAVRTMLADSKLPTTFWAEAVNTACYVQNRVLVVKPHNKTPYEIFHGITPTLHFMRPFGCFVTILNTIDHLGKFDGKADEGLFIRYSLNSKAFRVFNSRTRIMEENLHIRFSESTPNAVCTQSNGFVGTKASDNAGQARKETEPVKDYILLPLWTADLPYSQDPKCSHDDGSKPSGDDGKKFDEDPRKDSECKDQEKEDNVYNTNNVNATGTNEVNAKLPFDRNMPALEDYSIFDFSRDDEDDGIEADINNLDTTIQVSPIPTTRIHKGRPLNQVIGDLQSTTQTRKISKNLKEHGFVSTIQQRTNHKDLQNCLFACFLSQEEPKKVIHALKDPSWIEAMQEELLQFKLQEVWTLVDLPNRKKAIGTKEIKEEVYVCQPKLGLWYPKDSPFDLVAYTDSDYAGASLDRKSTIGEIDGGYVAFRGNPKRGNITGKAKKSVRLMMEKLFGMELELILVPQPSDPSDNIADEVVYKELGNSLVRDDTTASSLEAEQDNGNITKTRSKAIPNESSSLRTTSGGGPKGNTLQSDKDRLKLDELIALCTTLQSRVLDLEKTKTTQANEIASLKRRVKKLEKKRSSRTHKLKRLYKVGLTAKIESSGDEEDLDDADNEMFDVDALNGEEVFVVGKNENVVEKVVDAAQVSTTRTTVTITTEEITLAQALKALKTSKPKDKGKGIMIKEHVKPMKKKDLIRLDEEVALKLQAEFDEEEILAREKVKKEKKANISLIEEWDEKAKLFQQILEQRRKHFAAKSAEEKRNKPPTQAQQRKIMCTYLKNMEKKKLKDLKNKSFGSIQKMFDRDFKRVNTFVDFRTDLVEGSSKRAGEELEQESTKKHKVDEDKDTTELQSLMEVIPDEEEIAIDVEDLEDLYKLVKARYGSTRLVESMDYLLWNDLKTMFEPHVEDAIWRNKQGYKVLEWKLYDLYGVHSLMMQSMQIYMLVEKRHPLTLPTITYMLNKKLQVDYFSEMAYQLLKLLIKQLKN